MSLRNILFFDAETVPQELEFAKFSKHGRDTFSKRFHRQIADLALMTGDRDDIVEQAVYEQNVSVLAEYAKVAAISIGMVNKDNQLRMQTFSGPDEKELLTKFCTIVADQIVYKLCAHNGKAFDIPFLVRRLLINAMKLPDRLNILNLKPWDMKWICDTMEMWNLGDIRYNASLDRLAYAFNLPSPKSDMDGSKVASVFYSDDPDRFKKIGTYCQIDVVTLVCVYAYMTGNPLPVNLTNLV